MSFVVSLFTCTIALESVGVIGGFLKSDIPSVSVSVCSTINATNIMSNNKAMLICSFVRNRAIHTATPQTKPHTSTPVQDVLAQSQSLAEALPRPCRSRAAQCYDLDKNCIPHRTGEEVSTQEYLCNAAGDVPRQSTFRSLWLAIPSSGVGCMCTHPRRISRGCSG